MLWKWESGRQLGKYKKMKLLPTTFFDCYLVKFEPGFALGIHTDPIKGGHRHYRCNILLQGEDAYVGDHVYRSKRIVLFRADLKHGTNMITKPRTLLSIGWKRHAKTQETQTPVL